jgi:RNA polymerase sigma factor (sigma-70 family)
MRRCGVRTLQNRSRRADIPAQRIYFRCVNKIAASSVMLIEAQENRVSEEDKARRFQENALPHLNAAYNLARWLVRNDQDAEDVVQEAYLRAYRFFDGFRGDAGRPWLLAIVRNTCYTWMEQNREQQLATEFDENCHSLNEQGTINGVSQELDNPETALARLDDARQLNTALQALPFEFREVLVMRELEELSYKEIAIIASVPIGTVMSRLARGRKLLLQRLKELNGGRA